MKLRNAFLILIILVCVVLICTSSSRTKLLPQSAESTHINEEVVSTPLRRLGKRSSLVYHFKHLFDIDVWRHVTTATTDEMQGISKHIVIVFGSDPVTYANLAVDLDGNDKRGAKVIVEFLGQFLHGAEYESAIKLLNGGGQLTLGDRYVSMYHDTEIRKAIFEIKWLGE